MSKKKNDPAEESGKPKKMSAKKSQGRLVLYLALGGGGLFALSLCCAGAGVGGYFLFFSGPSITGKWESSGPNPLVSKQEWEFHRGGTGQTSRKLELLPGQVKHFTGHFEYKIITGDPNVVEMKLLRVDGDITQGVQREIGKTARFKMNLDKDTLKLTRLDPELRFEDSITLKRIP